MTSTPGYALTSSDSLHESEDEVVIVIEGELDDQVGDDRGALTWGGMLWFPRRVPHAVANLSQEPCRCITVVTPSGIEYFFRGQRDYLTSVPAGHLPDPQRLAAVPGADLRRVVGPPLTARN